MKYSVIIPVFNNSSTLVDLHNQIIKALHFTKSYEIIYVDDSSVDHSRQVLDSLESPENCLKVICNSKNIGQQLSIMKGLKKSNGEILVVMDADLQDSPQHIEQLVSKVNKTTSAFIKRTGHYQSIPRMITSKILKYYIYSLTGLNPNAGSYYALHKQTLKRLLQLHIKPPYISIQVAVCSLKIEYITAKRSTRFSGKSSYDFIKRLKAGVRAIKCAKQSIQKEIF